VPLGVELKVAVTGVRLVVAVLVGLGPLFGVSVGVTVAVGVAVSEGMGEKVAVTGAWVGVVGKRTRAAWTELPCRPATNMADSAVMVRAIPKVIRPRLRNRRMRTPRRPNNTYHLVPA
jgi:hypothetical protein